MSFTAFLCFQVLLVLMGKACSSPVPLCKSTTQTYLHNFKHVSHLGKSSVAPWALRNESVAGRIPEHIQHAECTVCTVPGMIAKPIKFQVHVFNWDSDTKIWKRCPYDVTVGCTCVREQHQ